MVKRWFTQAVEMPLRSVAPMQRNMDSEALDMHSHQIKSAYASMEAALPSYPLKCCACVLKWMFASSRTKALLHSIVLFRHTRCVCTCTLPRCYRLLSHSILPIFFSACKQCYEASNKNSCRNVHVQDRQQLYINMQKCQ